MLHQDPAIRIQSIAPNNTNRTLHIAIIRLEVLALRFIQSQPQVAVQGDMRDSAPLRSVETGSRTSSSMISVQRADLAHSPARRKTGFREKFIAAICGEIITSTSAGYFSFRGGLVCELGHCWPQPSSGCRRRTPAGKRVRKS